MNHIQNYCESVKKIYSKEHPARYAWDEACNNLEISQDSPWRAFGLMFCAHPDLIFSNNAYHNHYHSAEAVIAASVLAKLEKLDFFHAITLCFSMLCHDLAHSGQHNQHPFELEQKAIDSVDRFFHDTHLQSFWSVHLAPSMGNWELFFEKIKVIILGTDFQMGPKQNLASYQTFQEHYDNDGYRDEALKLPLLANEADTLSSVTEELGVERGARLAIEQNKCSLATPQARLGFLKMVIYSSHASQLMGINSHIQAQILEIEKSLT